MSTEFENFSEHLDVHSMFLKSVEFEGLPIQLKQQFVTHYQLTLQRFMSIPRKPDKIDSPRVSLQLHGTVGPTGAAEILNATGVRDVTPEIMQESPLETVVFDNVDKPNPGEPGANVGNDPYAQAIMKQEMAKQDMMNKELAHEQSLRHVDDKHQLDMINATAKKNKA